MDFTYARDDGENLVVVHLAGEITLEGILDLHRSLLADPHWQGGCRMIYDLSGVSGGALSFEDVMTLAKEYGRTPEERASGPVAIVAPDDLAFGTLRMLRAPLQAIPRLFQIFRDTDSARAWLGLPGQAVEIP